MVHVTSGKCKCLKPLFEIDFILGIQIKSTILLKLSFD